MNRKKLSLLCFIDSLNSGGAQKQMVHLSNGLSKFYDVTLLKYHGLEFFSEKVDKNVKLVTIEHKNQFVRFFKIISFLYKMKPRFIISFLRGPNNYSLIYKLLFFWRKNILIVGERNLNVGNFRFKDFMSRALYFKANHIVCNSNAQKIRLKHIFGKKLVFIPNGTKFNGSEKIDYTKETKTKFIVAARLMNQKNPMGLLKSIKNIDNICIHWFGEVFKSYPIYKECINFIKSNNLENKFILHPPSSDIYKEMVKYDALILPSFYEGCPNAIIDAMFCGLPVLASKVSDNEMYLNHQNELLFDPYDKFDIIKKIKYFKSLNNHEIASIGKKNKIKAFEYFNHKNMVNSYNKLIS